MLAQLLIVLLLLLPTALLAAVLLNAAGERWLRWPNRRNTK